MATLNFNTANQTYRQLVGNGLIYTVPRFQRDYSWTETEWEDLWNDILMIVENNADIPHYMGFLVFQSRDNKNFDVIDGQQRLTTMSIIILGVLDHLKQLVESGVDKDDNRKRAESLRNAFIGYLDPVTLIPRSKLKLNRNNDTLYQKYLVPLLEAPKRNLKATEQLMRKAYNWFHERIGESITAENRGMFLAKLVEQFSDGLFFTVITVADELNAYKVFETLNAIGVKLSSTDLLKNYLFSVVHKEGGDEHNLNALDDRWESLVGKLGSESFPQFLRTYWNSRYKFVRHAELFKRIREKVIDSEKVFELVRNMESDVDVYAALSHPEDELWNKEQRGAISELNMFGIRQPYPMLLAAFRSFSVDDLSALLRICSIISFRYNIIGGLSPNEQEGVYNNTAEKIASGVITEASAVIQELKSVYVNDVQFETAFSEKQLKTTQPRNKRIVRYLLFKIEKQISGRDLDLDSPIYTLEHILPENPSDGWEYLSDTDAEQLIYRLGNMTLLEASANRKIGNASFFAKKEVLSKSDFKITAKVASDNNDWNEERIAQRQRWMASQAKTIWKVSQLS